MSLRRREFVTLLGGAAAWPLAAHAQRASIPIVGQLTAGGGSLSGDAPTAVAFRKGLGEIGYVEGQNLLLEYRATERADQLSALAIELVRRRVALIVTTGNANSALAAKAATTTIPIVFVTSTDPVKSGLVASLNRPGGNVTGVTNFGGELVAKRLQLLREVVPQATVIGFLTNPANSVSEGDIVEFEVAARSLNQPFVVLTATTAAEIDAAFTASAQRRLSALVIDADTFFNSRREQITALATRHAIPATYNTRAYPVAGGLMSYGDDRFESYHQLGVYAGRILQGENPADLPIMRPSKFELVINLKAAKAIGIAVPPILRALATEVIE
jgi:putative ABC transport system substrate-binding protein